MTAPPPAPHAAREDEVASASVVTRDRTPRSAESATQLVSELPGVSVTRFGGLGALATLSLRGGSPNQVLVYVDGVPLNSSTCATVDLGLLPLTAMDRIEVYRGTSPLAFGASAMGGVLSLTTTPPEATGATARAGLGSFGTRLAGGEASWAGARARVVAGVSALDSRGDFAFENGKGTGTDASDDVRQRRENNALEQLDAATHATVELGGRRRLSLAASALRRRQGLPGTSKFATEDARLDLDRLIASAGYDGHDDLGAGGRLRAHLYALVSTQRFLDRHAEINFTPTASRDRAITAGATTTAGFIPASWVRLTGLVDARQERFSPSDELAMKTPSPGSRLFVATGAEADFWIEALSLDVVPSARVEAAWDEITTVSGSTRLGEKLGSERYVVPVLRLGLLQRPTEALTFRANVGRYARLPTMMERYGNNGRIVGTPDLRPERGVNADLGARLALGDLANSLAVDAALFAARTNDLIHFQAGNYFARYANISAARVVGLETALAATVATHGRFVGQLTFSDARDESGVSGSDGKPLPLRPRLRAYVRPELRTISLGRHLLFGIYGDLDVTGGNTMDSAGLVKLPGRTWLGAGASLAAPAIGLRAIVSAQNLADSPVVDILDFPLPGRSVFLTLEWSSPTPLKELRR